MENATKALLMAGGILIAILTISIIVSLFNQGGNVSRSYSKASDMEAVTKFNANFTKYVGKPLSVHDVVTICNYADNTHKVTVAGSNKKTKVTAQDLKNNYTYYIRIDRYEDGYVKQISFTR